MTTYKDISTKIDPAIIEVLFDIKGVTDRLAIPFFLVGASARDSFFTLLFDVPTIRATFDIDLALKVDSWDQVALLAEGLTTTSRFEPVNKIKSCFRHSNGRLIDIVPFGLLESPSGKIRWPLGNAIMTTIGFEEAYACSQVVL
jgi:predicted nucleotidyltransferase